MWDVMDMMDMMVRLGRLKEANLRCDKVFTALEKRDFCCAVRALFRRERLTWQEVARCAPLTFHWSPKLLRWILERGPEEEIYCRCNYIRPEDGWKLEICASLLTAAAAVNDLAAVEVLLDYGYSAGQGVQTKEALQRRQTAAMTAWYRLLHLLGEGESSVNWVRLHPQPDPQQNTAEAGPCDPLAAAIWCGAKECALRLLPGRAEELSEGARQALRRKGEGDAPYQETVQAVYQALNLRRGEAWELEDLLPPEESLFSPPEPLAQEDAPLLRACLERRGETLSPCQVGSLLRRANQDWVCSLLRLVPSELVTGVLLQSPGSLSAPWRMSWSRYRAVSGRIFASPELQLSIHRCQVFPGTKWRVLLDLMEHGEIAGAPPPGELSGLAVALLDGILEGYHMCEDLMKRHRHRLLYCKKTTELLAGEDPKLVEQFLRWRRSSPETPEQRRQQETYCSQYDRRWNKAVPAEAAYLILVLLGLREERSYEL